MNRREFLRWTALGGAALAFRPRLAWAFSQTVKLRKFIQPLPGLGAGGIPLATPDRASIPGTDLYTIEAGEYRHQFHPDLPPSRLWGYADLNGVHGYLGGLIVATRDRPVRLRVHNRLPAQHPLPVDRTLCGAEGPDNRIAVHLHGGFVPWTSDGGPTSWFSPGNLQGETCLNRNPDGSAEYYYPNQQSARLMWYHDHAMGITRLNAYAGLATGYLVTDDVEQGFLSGGALPSIGIPLVLQEKTFVDGKDPNYTWGQVGDLWYPYLYEWQSPTGRWDYAPFAEPPGAVSGPLPVPSCVPEFFADTPVVNGAAYPYLEVQPRHYRFRILNGSQARFYNLQLYYADASGAEANLGRPGPAMVQIGTEGGFLPAPVTLNAPPQPIGFDPAGNAVRYTLLLAPAERADIVIDFSNVPPGSRLVLYNDAPAPFPMGDPLNDYFTGDPDQTAAGGAPTTRAGFGPNTRTLLQFRVLPLQGARDPASYDAIARGLVPLPPVPALDPAHAKVRDLTLNEDFDELGRLIQRLGTARQAGVDSQGLPTWGRNYMDPATETPRAGDVEVWRVFNLTGDTHPVHFHLVNVQVLSRQPFDPGAWNGKPRFTGPARPPDANERGWKETVRMNPGECTTVIMRFDLPQVPFAVPQSPRTGGYEYVWHCHILEHEEHDMMRPLVVTP
ncbi:multicopper oxidase family protein [Anaeromyxobacter paludicola]|uniref:Spore coat protein A n=1 Tax=Anaeromyxobacter paludicola TaxID=2918171 RepID=A0ABM7XBX5_9BACT|nr:multicopper oxidase domain-containing protein [Anaeromyxobacter paludicola]BDG09336.1 spore coat protein A [Anaeromyxobacter paludicola]